MNRLRSFGRSLGLAMTAVALSACGADVACLQLPCPFPLALTITLTNAATGGTVQGAVVQIAGPMTGTAPGGGSPTTCMVSGYAGTYSLDISAPGFQTAKRTVTVEGSAPAACGCGTTTTAHVDVALVAAP